jgi:hypothetical protein
MSTIAGPVRGRVDGVILRVLKKRRQHLTTSKVVSIVLEQNRKFSDVDVKRAVWRMIAARRVELSPDQFLRLNKPNTRKGR